jgi:hypothetical protein
MDFAPFSTKWFLLYYLVLGLFAVGFGLYLIIKEQKIQSYLLEVASDEKPPRLFIRILKYLLLFTLPGLILAFLPFSWIELLFTLWSLFLVYLAGIRLVRWEQTRVLIKAKANSLGQLSRKWGAIMVAVGLAIFLLAYLVIKRTAF